MTIQERFDSLIGKQFGRLTILSHRKCAEISTGRLVQCKCLCGASVEKQFHLIKRGTVRSCGCLKRDMVSTKNNVHGFAQRENRIPEYMVWKNMKGRCFNRNDPRWKHYGARGITVCDLWKNDFAKFFSDVGPRPSSLYSLDRINNDGNYEPGNVRWATRSQQMRNYRRNAMISFGGENLTKTEWCERLGIRLECLNYRIKNWSLLDALTRKRRNY